MCALWALMRFLVLCCIVPQNVPALLLQKRPKRCVFFPCSRPEQSIETKAGEQGTIARPPVHRIPRCVHATAPGTTAVTMARALSSGRRLGGRRVQLYRPTATRLLALTTLALSAILLPATCNALTVEPAISNAVPRAEDGARSLPLVFVHLHGCGRGSLRHAVFKELAAAKTPLEQVRGLLAAAHHHLQPHPVFLNGCGCSAR